MELLFGALLFIGIVLQLGGAFGGLKDKEKVGAFFIGFVFVAIGGVYFFYFN